MNKFGKIYIKKIPLEEKLEGFLIKVMVEHPMESGYRHDKNGKIIPRNIIEKLRCYFNGDIIFNVDLSPAVSRNPMFQFSLMSKKRGILNCLFVDQYGNKKSKSLVFVD